MFVENLEYLVKEGAEEIAGVWSSCCFLYGVDGVNVEVYLVYARVCFSAKVRKSGKTVGIRCYRLFLVCILYSMIC